MYVNMEKKKKDFKYLLTHVGAYIYIYIFVKPVENKGKKMATEV